MLSGSVPLAVRQGWCLTQGRKAWSGELVGHSSTESTCVKTEACPWRDSRREDSHCLDRDPLYPSPIAWLIWRWDQLLLTKTQSAFSHHFWHSYCLGTGCNHRSKSMNTRVCLTRLVRMWDYLMYDWGKDRARLLLGMVWCEDNAWGCYSPRGRRWAQPSHAEGQRRANWEAVVMNLEWACVLNLFLAKC